MPLIISSDREEKIKENVYIFLEENGFNKNSFSLSTEELWRKKDAYHRFDIVIYRDSLIWCVIEIAGSKSWMKPKENGVKKWLNRTSAEYGIITDGTNFSIIKNSSKIENASFNAVDKSDLVKKLIRNSDVSWKNKRIKICSNVIRKFENGKKFSNKISFNKSNRLSFQEKYEKNFFEAMLGLTQKTIYRYVSFDTLFSILNEKTYRMSGLAGMNDKSEPDYFDNYLGDASKIENDIFISSCSLLKDELTMWRLYGEDGCGACLVLEIQDTLTDSFSLLKVDYGSKKKGHNKIDLLQELQENSFSFQEMNKWKHFFKPYEFKSEKEVRLLFTNNNHLENSVERKWIKTFRNSIINPIVDIPLNEKEFPLKLKSIILGPKFPEKRLNQKQLKEMIKDRELGNIKVYYSKIENYR